MVGVSLRRKFSSPGATTMDNAERMGIRPVMKEARPAVQLACPYQLVKTAPSFAMRSRLGVGWPKNAPPPEYAPKSFHPVSSVMSMTMLGLSELAACAYAVILLPVSTTMINIIAGPTVAVRRVAVIFITAFLRQRILRIT